MGRMSFVKSTERDADAGSFDASTAAMARITGPAPLIKHASVARSKTGGSQRISLFPGIRRLWNHTSSNALIASPNLGRRTFILSIIER